jgi:peptidoglycan/xylan/chitin deacetylase (PgdA/CDA1 family)
MSFRDASRRPEQSGERQQRVRRERLVALGSLILVAVTIVTIVVANAVGSGSRGSGSGAGKETGRSGRVGALGTATVPILMYHVIGVPPPQSTASPALYVPADEFASQMNALKADGWHAVTLDQLEAYWTRGVSLGPGNPIVITFDRGYASQYTDALPVLKQLGWVGVENLQVNGLSPSDGGLTDAEVRGLIAAGWEVDTQGISHADEVTLDANQLSYEVATARQILRSRYGAPVNWYSYPSGDYDATVIAAVRSAGFVGSTTVVPGWASPQQNRYALPRLQVLSGTSGPQLSAQIAAAKANTSAPSAYTGAGLA